MIVLLVFNYLFTTRSLLSTVMLYNILFIISCSLFVIMARSALSDVPYPDHLNYMFAPSESFAQSTP